MQYSVSIFSNISSFSVKSVVFIKTKKKMMLFILPVHIYTLEIIRRGKLHQLVNYCFASEGYT